MTDTVTYQEQAEQMGEWFASLPPDEQPQLIVSSRYFRCLQTAFPTAQKLQLPIMPEPGLSEWFPPAFPETSGNHPFPPRLEDVEDHFPAGTLSHDWAPLLYASPQGETTEQLYTRVQRVFHLLETRCDQWGVKRILICCHAAPIIALGRAILDQPMGMGGKGFAIGAGTCSLSLYVPLNNDAPSFPLHLAGPAAATTTPTIQGKRYRLVLNGSAHHLNEGVERNWDFDHLPNNPTERGQGDWEDEARPTLESKGNTIWMEDEQAVVSFSKDGVSVFEGVKL